MKKSQSGITVTILAVTIIIMAILLGVTMNVSTDLLSDTRLKTHISEMLLVQAKVKSMGETLEFEGAFSSSGALDTDKVAAIGFTNKVGTHISLNSKYKNQVSDEAKSSNRWYKWGANELTQNGFDKDMLTDDEVYFVDYMTGEVVSSTGYTSIADKATHHYSLQNMIDVK